MLRGDTIKEIVDTLSTEGEALAYPDHPLVLDGPSVLRLAKNVLTASFVYTRGSRPASSVAEQARVLLARLAYPEHTVFEAIFEADSMPETVALRLFDSYRVVTPQSLSQPDGDEKARTQVSSAIKRLRRPHFARFAANQLGRPNEHSIGDRASFTQFSNRETPHYKFVAADHGNLTAHVPEGPRPLTIRRIQRVAETFIASDYGLGLGISALTDVAGAMHHNCYLGQHKLRTDLTFERERMGIDVSKPLRAAQFAGGLVTSGW